MAINKVVYGNTTLLDLTNDTVASEKMLQDTTAHGADGSAITGSIVNRGVINAIIDATDSNYRYALHSGYYKSGSVLVIREQRTVTPSASSFVVRPENGHVLSQVTVNAIDSSYVGPNVVRRSSTDLSASGSVVTVPSGYYTNQVTKAIDSGTYKSDYSIAVTPGITINSSGLIQSYVNVTNVSIPVETSGYFKNTSSLSTVVRGASSKQLDVLAQTTYIPSSISQTIPSGIYLTGVQTITGDSNLIANNIKNGTTIFGVSGTFGPDDIMIIGDYGLCFNNFTITENTCTSEAGTVSGNTLIAV